MRGRLVTVRSNVDRRIKIHGTGTEEKYTRHGADRWAFCGSFAVPSIIAMLVGALYNIVDQFFIGRSVGELGNAATNVAFPLTISCVALALLFGIGGAASFNLTLGGGDREKALFYIGNAAMLLFGSGVILGTVALFA